MFKAEEAQHMLYGIGNAPIRDYPFPHFVVENVFSDAFYGELVASMQSLAGFVPIGETARLTGAVDPNRAIIDFTEKNVDSLPAESRPFWGPFREWLQSDAFTVFLLKKFHVLLEERFSERLRDAVFGANLQLVSDSRQYRLKPHTDHPKKVVVLLFYLPPDETNADLGTSFYVPNDPRLRCDGTMRHDPDEFTRVITFPYRPNTVVGFFKSGRSFHGVDPIEQISGTRYLIQLSVEHGFPGTSEMMRVLPN